MTLNKQTIEVNTNIWSVPQWVKVAITFFTFSIGGILILALLSAQEALLGLSTELIVVISLGLASLLILVTVSFWSFPNSAFTLFLYWLIRFLREQICLLALLGIVYLLTVRVALFSFRGGIPLINLILLFLMGLFVQPVGLDHFPFSWMKRFFKLL